jgi:3-hydroxyacyl-CoA dehydrogenase/enoyl-CoA hydratase/3-hydroxybutyryl-CoA epimerase
VDGKAQKGEAGAAGPELAERILAPLLAAAERCVRDGVVADADLADAGVIFGTGFAPHTGGPLHYSRSRGKTRIGGDPVVTEGAPQTVTQE